MKRFVFILPIAALLLPAGCRTDDTVVEAPEQPAVAVAIPDNMRISREEAIAELQSVLDAIDEGTTRAGGRHISSVDALTVDRIRCATRSSEQYAVPVDTLLYLVNFDDDAGSAILAASRCLEPVLAVTDEGNMTMNELTRAMAEAERGAASESIVVFIADLIGEYCRAALLLGDMPADEDAEPTRTTWNVTEKVKPFVTIKWNQDSPFNDQCPILNSATGERCAAGCVPIAIAQMTVYFKFPEKIGDTVVDWDKMKGANTGAGTPAGANELAAWYCALLGSKDYADVTYGEQTSASGQDVKDCLHKLGFKKVTIRDGYDKNNFIKNYVGIGKPVLIRAEPDTGSGHRWLLDGYMRRTDTSTGTEQLLFHSNFGWGGRCNGYYASKVYELYKAADEYETGDSETFLSEEKNGQYTLNKNFKYATYGDPRK